MDDVSQFPPWVPIGPAQADQIFMLVRAMEESDGTPYRSSYEEILETFDPAYDWRAMAVWGPQEKLIAYGLSRRPVNHGDDVGIVLSGGVHPEFRNRGLGRQLLEIQLTQAQHLVPAGVSKARAFMHVDSDHAYLVDLLKRADFRHYRSYVQMRRPLDSPIGPIKTPSFISIEPLTIDRLDAARRAHNAIYYELAGMPPRGPEQWLTQHRGLEEAWSFLAVDRRGDRPRVAGYLISSCYEQDWAARGWSEGYIDEVAVHNEWRGHNVLTSLLNSAMLAYQGDGIEFAGLDADIDPHASDPNVAVASYENLGFEWVGQTYVMDYPLSIPSTK